MQLLAEIAQAGGRHAIGARAEIDLIEIEVENLVLRERAVDANRKDRLLRLAQEGLLARKQEVLRNLLGDRGRAFPLMSGNVVV